MGLLDRLRNDDPRVAFIGIDGVPFSLIDDHPDVFPHLTSLVQSGSGGPIDSIVPPESAACWPGLTCGVNPGETGVYGFTDREPGSYETYLPMGSDVQAPRLWDRITAAGRQATVLNVPITFPPQRNIQRMVSGMMSPSVDDAASSEEVAEQLEAMGYRVDVDASLGKQSDKSEFIADAHETLDARAEAFGHYIREDDWDLFFGVFMAPDRINHFLFRDYEQNGAYHDAFLDFYAQLDAHIGRLHEEIPDEVTLLVASDHGFTTLEHEVHLNTWLREEGWLTYQTDDPEALGDISAETLAYAFVPGRFYINLEDRDPRGAVPQERYRERRAELAELLREFEGPDGRPVCSRVIEREAVFAGAHDDLAPDLVAIPNDGFDLNAGFNSRERIFDIESRTGMHTFDNATLITDEPDLQIEGTDLFDLAPTMLELMDVEYEPGEFEGNPLATPA